MKLLLSNFLLLIVSTVLLLTASCSGTKTVAKRLNNQYADISVKSTCDCDIDQEIENTGRYKPPMSVLLDKEKFNTSSNWTLENDFEGVYFVKMYADRGAYRMSLLSKKPIKIIHLNTALTLNLTPCNYKSEYYKIPLFSIELTKQDDRDLNEEFDYTATSYFDYLASGTNMRSGVNSENILKKIVEERFFYFNDNETSIDYKRFIKDVNSKYKTHIKETELLYTEDGRNTVDEFIIGLENSKIDISEFIVSEFVLTSKTDHKINIEEERRLKDIFSINDDLLFKKIDFNLNNQLYNGYIGGERGSHKRIAVELNTAILRKWNATAMTPNLDTNGNGTAADILIHTDGFNFSNYTIDKMKIDSLCTSISEITGTGILMEFDQARLIFPQKEVTYNYRSLPLNVENYPFFKNNNEEEKKSNYDITQSYTPSLTNFTGLLVPSSNIQIPINEVMLSVKGNNIIMNNRFISGVFEIKKSNTGEGGLLELSTNKFPIIISKEDLLNHFKNIGMNEVEIKLGDDSIAVFFKKEVN